MMCRSGARPVGAIALAISLGLSVFLGTGCQSTFPGASFEKQVDELRWSLAVIFDPELEESMESLKSDLRTLFDPELDQLPETIEMLGW